VAEEPDARDSLSASVGWAVAILVVGVLGIGVATALHAIQPPAAEPPQESPLGRLSRDIPPPPANQFPVTVKGRALLGAYMPGRGSAVAVLDQVRCGRVVGVPPAPAGWNVFGLRVGVAIDLPTPVDSSNLSFALTTTEGGRADAVTVGGGSQLQPGPDLNVLDVYFHVPVAEHPKELLVHGRSGELRLPACPVSASGDERGSES
jgi:hypothetical protein